MFRDPGNDLNLAIVNGSGGKTLRLTREQRAKQLLLLGVPGSGKSKLAESMFRQDVSQWYRHHCGIMLLDPHGSFYRDAMEWLAACNFRGPSIIPVNLTRSDVVMSYNLLRRRMGGDPAVHIQAAIDGMLHCFNQSGTNDTPRLGKWLEGFLFCLYEQERPLVDALELLSDPVFRADLTGKVQHVVARATWRSSRALSEREFQEVVESTANRMRKFLSTELMRAMLSQTGESLDLGAAIRDGAIVLVNLSVERALIKPEDARTLGTLLLSDLWTSALARGAPRRVRPFYIYVDEAQLYVTPTIADMLDQARKFGLHFTFGMQYLTKLAREGPIGQQMFESFLATCRSKIVFQMEHPEDVETLALWMARQAIDPDKIKHEIYSPMVVGQDVRYLPSYGQAVSDSTGGGTQISHTDAHSHTVGSNWSHADTENESFTGSDGTSESVGATCGESDGLTDGTSSSMGRSHGTSAGESETAGTNWGDSEGESLGLSRDSGRSWGSSTGQNSGGSSSSSTNRLQSATFDRPGTGSQRDMDRFWNGELTDDEEDSVGRNWGRSFGLSRGASESEASSWGTSASESAGGNESQSESHGTSRARSRGGNHARGLSRGESSGRNESSGMTRARTHSQNRGASVESGTSHTESSTVGYSSSDSYGGSEEFGTSEADTYGTSASWAKGVAQSENLSPVIFSIIENRLSSRTYRSVQEQVFDWTKYLAGQPDRHCLARLAGMSLPVPLVTIDVKRLPTTKAWVERFTLSLFERLPFALQLEDVRQAMAARTNRLLEGPSADREPVTTRRKLIPAPRIEA